MIGYAVRRLLFGGVPLLLAVVTITFLLLHAVPGGPWDRAKPLSAETRETLDRIYHLDRSLPEQYGHFLLDLAQGDLGVSFTRRDTAVTELIGRHLVASLILAISALTVALPLGLWLGIRAGLHPGGRGDSVGFLIGMFGSVVPAFALGLGAIILFSVELGWLPVGGWGGPQHVILPAVVLAIAPAGYIARVTRAAVREAADAPYRMTAAAKGLSEASIIRRHILPNATAAPLMVMGPLIADLLAGAFLVETIFGIPGLGRLFVQSIFQRDYGVVLGLTLYYAVLMLCLNLLADLLQASFDPRVRRRTATA